MTPLLLLGACTPSGSGRVPGTPPGPVGVVAHSGSAPPPGQSTPAHTGASGHTGQPYDPCDHVPSQLLGARRVSDVPPSEEFAFDALGHALNATDSAGVFRTDFGGDSVAVSPGGSSEYAGARPTPDGSALTLCDEGGSVVLLVDLATGSREDLVSVTNPNSVGWDDWGRLWIGANSRLYRYDPAVGGAPEIMVDRPGADADGITFSPDGHTVYFNDDSGGEIGFLTLDADGEPAGGGVYTTLGAGYWSGAELDGMTTDVCGNLYVVRTDGMLVRIRPDRTEEVLVQPSSHWTTAVNFGSGVGGWERDRLYVMDRSEGLWELEVGVEGHPEPHLP